jgi:folate-binding protein YgfZ
MIAMSVLFARRDYNVVMVVGDGASSFIDGLSTNVVPDDGGVERTCFTDRTARILATAFTLRMGNGVVLVLHSMWAPRLMEHFAERRLGQPLEFRDLSSINHVTMELHPGPDAPPLGSWRAQGPSTVARIHDELVLSITPGAMPAHLDDPGQEWTSWRVRHRWPEDGAEVTRGRHPLACGLESVVHPNKGCYTGQEVLTRMRSRGRSGWTLRQGPTSAFDPADITSEAEGLALAVVRSTPQ